jgi:catechol 2,3-dioxygenase-like lactoylglutathione lyase family enzyme
MSGQGIHHLYVRTRDYAATLAFWQELGFTVGFETGHGSAQLLPPAGGPYVFVDIVGEDQSPTIEIYLDVADPTAVDGTWEATHWGTSVQQRCDPDGRIVWLQHQP